METICEPEFWLNFNSTQSGICFNECFTNTIMIWLPCVFLLVFLPMEIYYIKVSKSRDIPLNAFNTLKMILVIIIILISLDEFTSMLLNPKKSYNYPYLSALKLIIFVSYLLVIWGNLKKGIRSSGISFCFSFISMICSLPQMINILHNSKIEEESILYAIHFICISSIFGLNFFIDPKPRYSLCTSNQKSCPIHEASFVSRICLRWFDQYINKVNEKQLEDNLWEVDHENCATYLTNSLEKQLDAFFSRNKLNERKDLKQNRITIFRFLFKIFAVEHFQMFLWRTLVAALRLGSPILLGITLKFLKTNKPSWMLYSCAIAYIPIFFFLSFSNCTLFVNFSNIQVKVQTILMSMIYRKALRINDGAKSKYTSGEIVALVTTDVRYVSQSARYLLHIWSVPFQLLLSFYFVWEMFGFGAIFGFLILLLYISFNKSYSGNLKKLTQKEKENKKNREKFLQDLLSGIKIIKMYSWENSFLKKCAKLRLNEYQTYIRIGRGYSTMIAVFNSIPTLVSSVIFFTYVYFGSAYIEIGKAFVVISFLTILRGTIKNFSQFLTNIVQGYFSAKKIDEFLNLPELDTTAVSHDITDEALIIKNGTFSWNDKDFVLENLNLNVPKGSLVSVIGRVGAGKSSLISVFLGQLYKVSGYVNVNGRTAYVPQQAWILNASVKDNITMGTKINDSLYTKALSGCALYEDLKTFPAWDSTEIGEKGINLSGGQKQRINLARAICCDADIYFLDDTLSAVDFQISKHIFSDILGPNGLLKDKTRFLVTHNVSFLSQSDFIVFLENGKIVEAGTYSEMERKPGYLSQYLLDSDRSEKLTDVVCTAESEGTYSNITSVLRRCEISTEKEGQKTTKFTRKEQILSGKIKNEVLTFLIKKIGIRVLLIVLGSNILQQIFSVSSRTWLSLIPDPQNPLSNHSQYYYLLIFTFLGLLEGLMVFTTNSVLMNGICKASAIVYNQLVEAVLRWPLSLLDSIPVGRIINRATSDSYTLDDNIGKRLVAMMEYMTKFIVIILVTFYVLPMTLIIYVLLVTMVIRILHQYEKLSAQLQRINANNRSPFSSFVIETWQGLHSIRANDFYKRFLTLCNEKIDLYNSGVVAVEISQRWFMLRAELLCSVTISVLISYLLYNRDNMEKRSVYFTLSYIVQLFNQFAWFFIFLLEMENAIISVERIKEFIDMPMENYKPINSIKVSKQWPINGEIDFINYKLRYRKANELVLKGLTFSVKSREKIGIIGRTGAGKSSMILGILRMVEPDCGLILIDNVDITRIDLEILRSSLSVIPQDPILFLGSLRFNLDPNGIYDDESLWDVLEKSNLKGFVQQLPQGLEYSVEEGGENISCGQRQLICLARALLRRTKILLLDEATASVDLETDELIQNTIRYEFNDCTVLTIAHRLNTIQDYDRILVLKGGNIAEFDTPDNLMKSKNSLFYDIMLESGLITE